MARKLKVWKMTKLVDDGPPQVDLISTTDMRKFLSDAMKSNYHIMVAVGEDAVLFDYVSSEETPDGTEA